MVGEDFNFDSSELTIILFAILRNNKSEDFTFKKSGIQKHPLMISHGVVHLVRKQNFPKN